MTTPYKPYLETLGEYVACDIRRSENITVVADARALPFRDGAFGYAWASEVLEHITPEQQNLVAQELKRVGRSVCVTYPAEGHLNRNADPSHHPVRIEVPGFRRIETADHELTLLYGMTRVAVVADAPKRRGGTEAIIEQLKQMLLEDGYIAQEVYVDPSLTLSHVPRFLTRLLSPLQAIRVTSQDFGAFDAVITLHPFSHYIRHRRHCIYFLHHQRVYYDLLAQTLRRTSMLRKPMLLFKAFLTRLMDRLYLNPNLEKSQAFVLSRTVLERVERYNHVENLQVVYPGGYMENCEKADGERAAPTALSFSALHVPTKGLDLIIESAKLLPEVKFVIAGTFDPSLGTLTMNLPTNLTMVIKDWSAEERNRLYRECDVFLAPYLDEDFGLTPIEANSFGKPVVYCRDGGGILESQIHRATGYMCDRSPKSFAEGIEYCLRNKEHMLRECVENAKCFNWGTFRQNMRSKLSLPKTETSYTTSKHELLAAR